MLRARSLSLVVVALFPAVLLGQGNPMGPEFRVNTYTTDFQVVQSVAMLPTGNFVVVWHSNGQDGSSTGIFGQRYDAFGAPVGTEFRVNTFTTSLQTYPAVAASSGGFVVVWASDQDGYGYGVFGQRFDSAGAVLGPEFQINTYTTSIQRGPAVAADGAGNFVVIWLSNGQDGSAYGIFGQRFASSGGPLGAEFRVNTYTAGNQYNHARVASDPAGNSVVVWSSDAGQDGSGQAVMGQRYASSGGPQGPEFRVNTYTTGIQRRPTVTANAAGNFVILWNSAGQDGSAGGIFGQRYASSGSTVGIEFRVNTYTTGVQAVDSVATDDSGNFVVVWFSAGQDGSSYGVFGQRFEGAGPRLGPEFLVNTYTTLGQSVSAVAADAPGRFVVTWSSNGQDGAGYGIFGQRYAPILPVELMRFEVE